MQKFDRRNKNLTRVSLESYTLKDQKGVQREFPLEGKSQKDVTQFLVKVNGKSIRQAAIHLDKKQQNLFTTLERDNLSFEAFLQIYKFATGEAFKTGFDFIDDLSGLYHLKVKDVVNILEEENLPFVVKCGSYYYRVLNKKF
jgi:hypothetical protein